MRNMDRVIFGCLFLFGLIGAAQACTVAGWNGGATGTTNPDSPPNGVQRVSEFCGMMVTGSGAVQDNTPSHSAMIARFYVFPQLSGSGDADIFVAYSNEAPSGVLFDISYNGTQFNFSAAGAGGGSGSAPAVAGWNLIEVSFNSGGTFNFWVNSDATTENETGFFASGSGTIEAVRLGLPNGLGGFNGGGSVTVDDYESHLSTPVGPVFVCDAEGDEDLDINDVLAVVDEVFGAPPILAPGVPDCDLSGGVNINDALAIVDIVF